jgi:hypothetical protein
MRLESVEWITSNNSRWHEVGQSSESTSRSLNQNVTCRVVIDNDADTRRRKTHCSLPSHAVDRWRRQVKWAALWRVVHSRQHLHQQHAASSASAAMTLRRRWQPASLVQRRQISRDAARTARRRQEPTARRRNSQFRLRAAVLTSSVVCMNNVELPVASRWRTRQVLMWTKAMRWIVRGVQC